MRIRLARSEDRANLDAICLRTGDAGQDATDRYDDATLLGEVYVGPYLALAPEFAFVATLDEEPEGPAQGYCLGALDSVEFAARCERAWWPRLREQFPIDIERRGADQQLVRLIHQPPSVPTQLTDRYPSHLHIDLLPSLQGQGAGRALLERLLAALADAGSPGVHLGVATENTRAIGFYQRLGFAEVGRGPGTLLLARALA